MTMDILQPDIAESNVESGDSSEPPLAIVYKSPQTHLHTGSFFLHSSVCNVFRRFFTTFINLKRKMYISPKQEDCDTFSFLIHTVDTHLLEPIATWQTRFELLSACQVSFLI